MIMDWIIGIIYLIGYLLMFVFTLSDFKGDSFYEQDDGLWEDDLEIVIIGIFAISALWPLIAGLFLITGIIDILNACRIEIRRWRRDRER